jgi:Mn2+/Fe2+ NRAMP family transporter
VATLMVVHVSWHDFLQGLFWPHFSAQKDFWLMVVAVLGTTISPYLFFWQAQQEVEDAAQRPTRNAPTRQEMRWELKRIRLDTLLGMGLSNLIAVCIVVAAAATLHTQGIKTIESAAQAAEALRAVAGPFTFAVFALGIIGTGLLTVPVLAASAAYALGELLSWRVGLIQRASRARAFYAALALATLIGCGLNFTAVNPMRALYWSAVLNGVVAVPVMVAMMHMSARRAVVGAWTLPRGLRLLGWTATAVMALTVLALAVTAL